LQNSLLGTTKQINESGTSYYARTPDGLMVDERLPGGTSYNPIFDSQGDLIGLLNTSGNLVQTIRYGPYGENAKTTGSTYTSTIDPFLYQGGYHVAWGTSGTSSIPNDLYHYGERYYDPTTGRWTQPDPMGEEYEFVGDDPINELDPSGLFHIGFQVDFGIYDVGVELDSHGHVGIHGGLGPAAEGSGQVSFGPGNVQKGFSVEANGCAIVCGGASHNFHSEHPSYYFGVGGGAGAHLNYTEEL
jgi:RHS repeat-associated protein